MPIIHSKEETPSTVSDTDIERFWIIAKSVIISIYNSWIGVQLYIDSYAIPDGVKKDEYQQFYISEFLSKNMPLIKIINELITKGAILESTEITDPKFWKEYISTVKALNANCLDTLDRIREEYISKNINNTLKTNGLLLIGAKHYKEGKFYFTNDIDVKWK